MQVKEATEQLAVRSAELDTQREMLTTEDERLTEVLAEVKQGVQPGIISNHTSSGRLNGGSNLEGFGAR